MILKVRYPTRFSVVMQHFKNQVRESLPQAAKDYPAGAINSAEELWDALRPRVHYVNDPHGLELFQSYQTLFYNNWHGKPGAGDCDCFTLATAAVATVSNLPFQIVLAGRTKTAPVHIYTEVDGLIVDLTRPRINDARHYPILQKFELW